ncbi:hypothetical protein DFQ01_102132 [Paenibacillus cellulosilyticus]|uniref:Uncharacterized protein n=1 Tax=Paenibacillus cellulosilyticus TaxID=375489 RepID=A0A2V2YYM3_9BACL|nr:hypothetical protein [Paenibacillus cellulosilyticus]PWW07240.1 hypothetical protein DFQ01_102132 [Paenibacillus cellulosilyticus]QKS44569.1 hypothetical protein HUB94_09195 [Paenibacillus cellulosilyticus]
MNQTQRNVQSYLLMKLASAGFTVVFFWFFCLTMTGDWYQSFGSMQELKIWPIIYLYGISSSLVIDLILKYVSRNREPIKAALYIFFGLAYFSYSLKYNSFAAFVFVGAFGVVFALVYYWGTFIFKKMQWHSYIFAFALPIILFVWMNVSAMDRQVNWKETYTQSALNTYEATFDYFNGSKEIPVHVQKGQILRFKIVWDTQGVGNGGATGQHVTKPNGKYAPMEKTSDHQTLVRIEENGTYKIVADAAINNSAYGCHSAYPTP